MTNSKDRNALGVPALVAELHDKGIIFSGATIEVSVRGELWVKVVGAPSVGGDEMYSWCAVKDLGEPLLFPGIRNALVGAVLAWLKKNMGGDLYSRCIMIHSLGEVTVCDELDEEPTGGDEEMGATHITREYESDRDELRALLLAALAVADAKQSNTKEEGK